MKNKSPKYKGIILAGGAGTRLYPITKVVSKQLLPVYNKPMIYYPLSVLMLAGIREILIITTPEDKNLFERLLRSGDQWGIKIEYTIQNKPKGLADAFIIGENFIGNDRVALILGDNIFFGHGLTEVLQNAVKRKGEATIFGYHVDDPCRYGIAEFEETEKGLKVISVEEKPKIPKSPYAIVGLYFYDNSVIDIAKNLEPSDRGELEITDINKMYLEMGCLYLELLGRGMAWLDTGTYDALLDASNFIATIEKRQGQQIADLDEIARNLEYI